MLALNYRDSQPIYSQIKDGLRRLIVKGALAPGEKLPTVRDMAMDLAVNPNAIARAYTELEQEGLIRTVPGEGCFTCAEDAPADLDAMRKEDLMRQFRALVAGLRSLNVSNEELIAVIEEGGAK